MPSSEVAGNFLDPEEVGLSLQDAVHLAPEVALGAVNRWGAAIQKGLEAVDNSLVVDEDVDWPFGSSDEVKEGERFGPLGILGKPVHARRVVEPMLAAIVDAKGGAGEEGDGLVRACTVGTSVDPTTTGVWVRVVGELVAIGAFRGRPWYGLGGITRKLRL